MTDPRLQGPAGGRAVMKGETPRVAAWVATAGVGAVWALLGTRSLWFDELYALHAAGLPWRELMTFLRLHDAHPPLYPLLLKAWVHLFGSSELSLRAPSALAGVAAAWGAWVLARNGCGTTAAAVASLTLASSPLFLEAAADATRYALLACGFVWAGYETLRVLQEPGRGLWRLVLIGAALLYTHYLGSVLASSLLAFAAWQGGWRGLRRVAGALAGSLLFFAPWLPVLWFHMTSGRMAPPWRPAATPSLVLDVLHVGGFGGRVMGTASYHLASSAPLGVKVLLAAPVALVLALAAVRACRTCPEAARLAVCCVVLPALVLGGASAWSGRTVSYPRYFSFSVPYLALLVGAALEARCPSAGSAAPRVVAGLWVLVVALALWSLGEWAARPAAGAGDRKSLAAVLKPRLRAGDSVLVYPQWEFLGLDYYLPQLRGQYVVLPSVWEPAVPERIARTVREEAQRSARVWVVQANPMAPAHFEALYRRLSHTHRVSLFWEFDGVRLTLFVRRPGTR